MYFRRLISLLAILLTLLLRPLPIFGQISSPTKVEVKDEGTSKGKVGILDCAGAGISCAVSGDTGTLTVTGGSGTFAVTETEVDFDTCTLGTLPLNYCSFIVTDAGVSTTSKLLVSQSGNAPTGKQADENEMDQFICHAKPAAGSFTLLCASQQGPVRGKFKFNYSVG